MHETKNFILLLALGSLWVSSSRASPLTSTVSPAASTNSQLPIPTYSFEEFWHNGLSWIEFNYPGVELWSMAAAPPLGPSANVEDFTHVHIEAFDAFERRIIETTNIAGKLLWGILKVRPPPPSISPYEPYSDQRFSFSLKDAFQVVSQQGYAGVWKDLSVMQWRDPKVPPRGEPFYRLNRADPTPDCHAVLVGTVTGQFIVYRPRNDPGGDFHMSNGTKIPIQLLSRETA